MGTIEPSDIISQIKADHRESLTLLPSLERLATAIEQSRSVDYQDILDILDHFGGPGNAAHHHKEEQICDWIRSRHPAASQTLPDITADHKRLASQVDQLDIRIRAVLTDHDISRAELASLLRDFQMMQFNHIQMEELTFLSLADLLITENERAALTAQAAQAI